MAMQNYTHFTEWWDLISKVARTEAQVATPYDNLAHTVLASKLQQSISDPWIRNPLTKFSEETHDVVPKFSTL